MNIHRNRKGFDSRGVGEHATHQDLPWEDLQEGEEVVTIAQVLEQVSHISTSLQIQEKTGFNTLHAPSNNVTILSNRNNSKREFKEKLGVPKITRREKFKQNSCTPIKHTTDLIKLITKKNNQLYPVTQVNTEYKSKRN